MIGECVLHYNQNMARGTGVPTEPLGGHHNTLPYVTQHPAG
jgi:hypothetical protein